MNFLDKYRKWILKTKSRFVLFNLLVGTIFLIIVDYWVFDFGSIVPLIIADILINWDLFDISKVK